MNKIIILLIISKIDNDKVTKKIKFELKAQIINTYICIKYISNINYSFIFIF